MSNNTKNTKEQFLKYYDLYWGNTRYDTPEWRTFWTTLVERESGFNPNIENSIGAKGYFQLMPSNMTKDKSDIETLFKDADRLMKANEASFTREDYEIADALGISKESMLAGAWLGGVNGVRKLLYGKGDSKDMNGTSVSDYMAMVDKDDNDYLQDAYPTQQLVFSESVPLPEEQAPTVVIEEPKSNISNLYIPEYPELEDVLYSDTSVPYNILTNNSVHTTSEIIPNKDVTPTIEDGYPIYSEYDDFDIMSSSLLNRNKYIHSNMTDRNFKNLISNNTMSLGGNLFKSGGSNTSIRLDKVKELIGREWPATLNVSYSLKPLEDFILFIDKEGNPRGTIETIMPSLTAYQWSPIYAKLGIPPKERPLLEETNRVDYRKRDINGLPIGEILLGKNYITTDIPGLNTIIYNPKYTTKEHIKQDLLHVMHDNPRFTELYNTYMTLALNDKKFLYHDWSEADSALVDKMLNGEFNDSTNEEKLANGLEADSMLQALLDGYLRELFYPGSREERKKAGYAEVPYNLDYNPALKDAISKIKDYLEGNIYDGKTDTKDGTSNLIKRSLLLPERILRTIPAREYGVRNFIYDANDDLIVKLDDVLLANKGILHSAYNYITNNDSGALNNLKTALAIIKNNSKLPQRLPDETPITMKDLEAASFWNIEDINNTKGMPLKVAKILYDEADNYLDHYAGLSQYLGLGNLNRIEESPYSPTISKSSQPTKYYRYKSLTSPLYWTPVIEDLMLSNKNSELYIDKLLNNFTASKGKDSKGLYVSIYDIWDYNPSIKGGGKDYLIHKITGGTPFEIYDRVYLDDYYNMPEKYRGTLFLPEVTVTAPYNEFLHKYGGNIFRPGGTKNTKTSTDYSITPETFTVDTNKIMQIFQGKDRLPMRVTFTDRVRDNNSPTAKLSRKYEDYLYSNLPLSRTDFDIPFIPEKKVLVGNYTTSTNALDSIVKYAGIHNRTLRPSENHILARPKTRPVGPWEALGLSYLETKFGAVPYSNLDPKKVPPEHTRAFYNSNVFTAYDNVPAQALINNYHYSGTKKPVPPLLDGIRYYALGDYNRGDKNHTRDVLRAGQYLSQLKVLLDWWDKEGKYWYNGTYKNKGDELKK